MARILVVEDDQKINKMESTLLSRQGYYVTAAFSGTEALLLLERELFDVVLLDLMLPGMAGEEVLERIVKEYKVPVVCVSAKDALDSRVEMIHKGADDYIVKPFHNEELLVRIEAVLRRTNKMSNMDDHQVMKFNDLVLNRENHSVFINENQITLTAKEFQILELLMGHPQKVFSKENIFESVWQGEKYIDDSAVTVHVSNLRNKLSSNKDAYIKTVWGIGYKMQDL